MTTFTTVTSDSLSLPSLRRGSGPNLLLLHGAGGGAEANYGPIIDDLAGHFTLLAPDLPGSGGTRPASEPLGLDAVIDAITATADEAKMDTFGVVGYSLGSALAIRLSARYPSRVTRLALLAGFAAPSRYMRLVLDTWAALLHGDPAHLARFLLTVGCGEQLVGSLDDSSLDELIADIAASIPPGTAQQVALARALDVRADLASITVPTLILKTTLDRVATPAHSDYLAGHINSARVVELASGHAPFAERPQELTAALISHFSAATP